MGKKKKARQRVINEIVQIAIEKIGQAGCRSVDQIGYTYYNLLEQLGEKTAAKKVYQAYCDIWEPRCR